MQPRIGIDVGGVIIDRVKNDNTDTSFFSDNYLATSAVPGAFEGITQLVRQFQPKNVFIVSKCGQIVQDKTRHWLAHHGFYATTGFLPENAYFCRERYDKLMLCQQLGLTDMIDDRMEVLSYLIGHVPNLVLFQGRPEETTKYGSQIEQVFSAQTWAEVAYHLVFLSREQRCVK